MAFMAAEEERGSDPFELDGAADTNSMMRDDRAMQGTLDVGDAANTTADRSGSIAGSADFADRRDELQPDAEMGEQSGLVEMDSDVGDGQADLFGDSASTTTGGEYRR